MWSLVTLDPRSHVCSSIRSLVIGREGATKALAQVPPLESPYRDKDRKLSPSLPPLVVFVSLVPEYLGGMNPVPPPTHTHTHTSQALDTSGSDSLPPHGLGVFIMTDAGTT